MAHRLMKDPTYRQSQLEGVYAPHVDRINRLVDRLRDPVGRGWMPYVAPMYGGVNAQVLLLLRDPGPKTNSGTGFDGSGFLSSENDDATAERLAGLLTQVGLSAAQCTAWNSYPWFINQPPTASQMAAGVDPLIELLRLLDRLEVVVLLGSEARTMWARVEKKEPALGGRLRAIATRHASDQAFIGNPEQRAQWKADQLNAFQEAAAVVRGENPPRRVDREAAVLTAFTQWLGQHGWDVRTSASDADVVAQKGTDTLIAEVKGATASAGLDVDTMYGQLLRRMTAGASATRFAVVVPRSAAAAAARVPRAIRDLLKVDAYVVELDGQVTPLA